MQVDAAEHPRVGEDEGVLDGAEHEVVVFAGPVIGRADEKFAAHAEVEPEPKGRLGRGVGGRSRAELRPAGESRCYGSPRSEPEEHLLRGSGRGDERGTAKRGDDGRG